MNTDANSIGSSHGEEEGHNDIESIDGQDNEDKSHTSEADIESLEVQEDDTSGHQKSVEANKPEEDCPRNHKSKANEEINVPTETLKNDREPEPVAILGSEKESMKPSASFPANPSTFSRSCSSFQETVSKKPDPAPVKPSYSAIKRSAAHGSALKPTKRASTSKLSIMSSFVPRKEVGFSHDIAFRSPTFIEIIQAMGQSHRFDFFNRIRESFLNLMRPTLTLETNDIPNLDSFLTPNVLAAMDSLQGHFRSFWYRISVNAPTGGHHPMFDRHGLSRTGVLDPNAFRMASLVVNLDMSTTRSFEQLLAEIRQYNNIRVRNWLATHLNEQLSYISMQKQGSSKFYVRQNGLSLHEAALFYFICSRRRLLVDDIQILERAFPYFASDEIFRIVNQMSLYISTNPELDRVLQTFMDGYVRIMYRVFFAPLYADYLDIPVFHEDLNNGNEDDE